MNKITGWVLALVLLLGGAYKYDKDRDERKARNNPDTPIVQPGPGTTPPINETISGVDKIIAVAKQHRPDAKVNYWVFGGISSLAEALRKDPSIAPNIRVYFIASWNRTKADPGAWAYIRDNFKNKLELYRDESENRPFYSGGNRGLVSKLVQDIKLAPIVGKVWDSYPLEYATGSARTDLKAGDYPLYLYTKRPDLRAKVFKADGGKFKVSRSDDRYLQGDALRTSVFNEIRKGFTGWSTTDGTSGIPLILDSDIGLRGEQSDKDDQQALILLRGLLKGFNVKAFIGTNSNGAKGKKAFDQLFDELGTSEHLKARTYQGLQEQFKLNLASRPPITEAGFNLATVEHKYGANVNSWAETSRITSVSVTASKTRIVHSKENAWTPRPLADNVTYVNANLWFYFKVGNKWARYPFEHLRKGQRDKGVGFKNIDSQSNGLYNPDLRVGDRIGVQVSTQARIGGQSANGKERSGIVWTTLK